MKKRAFDIEDKIELKTEKIRKKSELSFKAIRQLEVLKHYYKVDEDNRIINIPIHYEKVSDIFDTNLGNKDHPFIKRDFLVSISTYSILFQLNLLSMSILK